MTLLKLFKRAYQISIFKNEEHNQLIKRLINIVYRKRRKK